MDAGRGRDALLSLLDGVAGRVAELRRLVEELDADELLQLFDVFNDRAAAYNQYLDEAGDVKALSEFVLDGQGTAEEALSGMIERRSGSWADAQADDLLEG